MLTDAQIRDRIVAMLREWPRGAATPGAIATYTLDGGRSLTRREPILAAMVADGVIEPCEIEEECHSRSGPYRRTFRGYRLIEQKGADECQTSS